MTAPRIAEVASGALRCRDYFVHVDATEIGENLWIADRARHTGTRGSRARLRAGAGHPGHHVFGSYRRLTDAKSAILALVAGDGQQVGDEGDWHVHHVVEGDIYADVHFEEVPYRWMYESVLPCVLVHEREHLPYFHGVSRSKASMELYGVRSGGTSDARAAAAWQAYHAARLAGDRAALAALRERVTRREQLFRDLYHYDAALLAIAAAVFRRAHARLDEPAR
jgi:hypothetical protein